MIGGFYKRVRAIVDEDSQESAVCIIPFTVTDKGEYEAFARAIEEYSGVDRAEVKVMTRSMKRVEEEEEKDDSEVQGVHEWSIVELREIVPERVESQEMGESVEGEKEDVVNVANERVGSADESEKESEVGVATSLESADTAGEEMEQVVSAAQDIGPVAIGKDREEFREAVREDESLKEWRELGDRRERGFSWKEGALVRGLYVGWEEFREVLVLPREYRGRVMKLGHDGNGHLGAAKVQAVVSKYFVWPGMARDLIEYCGSCELCQRKSKAKPRKAPAVERPIMAEPFERWP